MRHLIISSVPQVQTFTYASPECFVYSQVRNLLVIYLVCAVAAMVIVSLLLDPIKLDRESSAEDRTLSPKELIATVKHLISSPTQMLLVPLTVYSGVEQAFFKGDFSQVGELIVLPHSMPFHSVSVIPGCP